MMEFLYQLKMKITRMYYSLFVESIGKGSRIDLGVKFINGKKKKHKGIIIGNNCVIHSGSTFIADRSRKESGIIMKDYSGINRNCFIGGEGGLVIGKYSQIGPQTVIITTNHNFKDRKKPILMQELSYGKVVIEDDVWIGANCVILPNVKIGKGSIIGAGSVVSRDIPEYSIAVGKKAEVIKKR